VHAGCVVPDKLLPRWRDLPALAWLVRQRLSGRLGSLPVLGLLARCGGFLLTLVDLVGMRAERAVAARDRRAMLTVRQNWPLRVRWRYWTAGLVAVVPVALLYVAVGVFFAIVGVIAAHVVAPPVGSAVMFLGWMACGTTFLLGVGTLASGLRPAFGERRVARAWAASTGIRLVEAAMLAAAETDRRAATVLVLPLLRHADEHRIAVVAVPLNDSVARMYKALGFTPVSDGRRRILFRPPRSHPSGAWNVG
jgi:hypothetical protein